MEVPEHIRPLIIENSEAKARIIAMQEEIDKFADPLAGLTAMFMGLSYEEATELGIH